MNTQTINYPTLNFNEVIHIGSLNKDDKKMNSLEGAGLSVSVNPNEWQEIAKLGGNSWHRLTKKEAAFLDFHQLSDMQCNKIIEWGVQEAYLEHCTVYFYTWIDGETETEMIFESVNYNEILNEVEASDEAEDQVQEKEGYKATDKLKEATKHQDIPPFLVVGNAIC